VVAVVGAEESPVWAHGDGGRGGSGSARGGRTGGNVWLGKVLRVLGNKLERLAVGES
jgi:hypothetical protein